MLETPEIIFYQMNGLMLGTWFAPSLEADAQRKHAPGPGAFALAHKPCRRNPGTPQALRSELEQDSKRLNQKGDSPI